MKNKDIKVARLQWACRRGMLELDLILLRFLENRYLHLSNVQQETFSQLLTCEDQTLFNWLIKRQQSDNDTFSELISLIINDV